MENITSFLECHSDSVMHPKHLKWRWIGSRRSWIRWDYLDDLLIHSNTLLEHLQHLKNIFKICLNWNISINFEKFIFAQTEIKYLRMILTESGIKPDSDRLRNFENIEVKNKKQLQKLLGLLNYLKIHTKFSRFYGILMWYTQEKLQVCLEDQRWENNEIPFKNN